MGASEFVRSLRGAWLLARGDAAGMGLLDLTVEGFWNSFAAALVAAPAYVLLLTDRYARTGLPPGAGLAGTAFAESLAYLVDVATLPLLAIPLTRFLGLGTRYVPLVVASNWATVPQVALFVAAVALGLALPPMRDGFLLAAVAGTFTYQWFVVRTALGTTGATALAFILINLLVGAMLNRALDALAA